MLMLVIQLSDAVIMGYKSAEKSIWELLASPFDTIESQCIFEASFKAIDVRIKQTTVTSKRNAGSVLFHYDGSKGNQYQAMGMASVPPRDQGDLSGHSERVALQQSIKEAIEDDMPPFAEMDNPTKESFLSLEEKEKKDRQKFQQALIGSKDTELLQAIKKLKQIIIFSERVPCSKEDKSDAGCKDFLKKIAVNIEKPDIQVYHSLPEDNRSYIIEMLIDYQTQILKHKEFENLLEEKQMLLNKERKLADQISVPELEEKKRDDLLAERKETHLEVEKINQKLLQHAKNELEVQLIEARKKYAAYQKEHSKKVSKEGPVAKHVLEEIKKVNIAIENAKIKMASLETPTVKLVTIPFSASSTFSAVSTTTTTTTSRMTSPSTTTTRTSSTSGAASSFASSSTTSSSTTSHIKRPKEERSLTSEGEKAKKKKAESSTAPTLSSNKPVRVGLTKSQAPSALAIKKVASSTTSATSSSSIGNQPDNPPPAPPKPTSPKI